MIEPKFKVGNIVKTKRKIRNDGTFPGLPWGELLLPKGAEGVVIDVWRFLQTQVMYVVNFLERGNKGVITDLDVGEFRASVMVKFKNLELSAVIPKKMVTEWGLKVGDKAMVHIEKGGGVYIYKNKFT